MNTLLIILILLIIGYILLSVITKLAKVIIIGGIIIISLILIFNYYDLVDIPQIVEQNQNNDFNETISEDLQPENSTEPLDTEFNNSRT